MTALSEELCFQTNTVPHYTGGLGWLPGSCPRSPPDLWCCGASAPAGTERSSSWSRSRPAARPIPPLPSGWHSGWVPGTAAEPSAAAAPAALCRAHPTRGTGTRCARRLGCGPPRRSPSLSERARKLDFFFGPAECKADKYMELLALHLCHKFYFGSITNLTQSDGYMNILIN